MLQLNLGGVLDGLPLGLPASQLLGDIQDDDQGRRLFLCLLRQPHDLARPGRIRFTRMEAWLVIMGLQEYLAALCSS
jgi:hypothetical protein